MRYALMASVAGLALATLIGCGPSYTHLNTGTALALGAIAGGLAVATMSDPPERQIVVVHEPPAVILANGGGTVPFGPPSDLAPHVDDLPPFDPVQASSSLHDVDVSACSVASHTDGHAKVEFNPDGHITKVTIDTPSDLPPEVARCVSKTIGQASIAPFRGSMITVGTTFATP